MQDQCSICTTECWKLTLLLDETLAFQWLRLTKLSPACPPETPLSQLISDCGSVPTDLIFPKNPKYKQLPSPSEQHKQWEHKTHLSGPSCDSSLPDQPFGTVVVLATLGQRLRGFTTCTCGLVRMLSGFVLFTSGDTHVNSSVLSMEL